MGEGLLQLPGPSRGQLAGQQGVELLSCPPPYSAVPAQQRPAHVLKSLRLLLAPRPQACAFATPHLIHRAHIGLLDHAREMYERGRPFDPRKAVAHSIAQVYIWRREYELAHEEIQAWRAESPSSC